MSLSILLDEFPELVKLIIDDVYTNRWERAMTYVLQFVCRQFRNIINSNQRLRPCKKYDVAKYAIGNGYFDLVKWVVSRRLYIEDTHIHLAISKGHLNIFKFLLESSNILDKIKNERHHFLTGIFDAAAGYGSIENFRLVEKILSVNVEDTHSDVCYYAAQNEHFDMVKWLVDERNLLLKSNIIPFVALFGNVEFLKRLHFPAYMKEICKELSRCGRLDLLKQYIEENNLRTDTYAGFILQNIIKHDNLEVLKWYNTKITVSFRLYDIEYLFSYAAEHGNIEIIKWLIDTYLQGITKTSILNSMFIRAANSGNRHVVKWLKKTYGVNHVSGTAISVRCCGDDKILDTLEWLYRKGWKTNEDTYDIISHSTTNMKIFDWLYEHNCPWGYSTAHYAALSKRWKLLKWLLSHGCPHNFDVCATASSSDNLKMVKWIYKNNYATFEQIEQYARGYTVSKWVRQMRENYVIPSNH